MFLSYGLRLKLKRSQGYVANAFTPNNDGINDSWKLESHSLQSLSLEVFNRNGKSIFASAELDFSWDGTLPSGKGVGEGVYVYVMKGIDLEGNPFESTGTVTIIR